MSDEESIGRPEPEIHEDLRSGFHKELDDVSLLLPAVEDGLPFADLDGDGGLDPGEPLWVRTQSVGAAEIDGIEATLDVFLPWDLTLSASWTTTEGDDLRTEAPLAGIPPDYGAAGLRWQGEWRWRPWLEALVRWADDKDRLSPVEALDPGVGPGLDPVSLASYDTFTLRAGLTLPPRLRLAISLENPSDEAYKPYLSRLYSPARNLALTAEYTF